MNQDETKKKELDEREARLDELTARVVKAFQTELLHFQVTIKLVPIRHPKHGPDDATKHEWAPVQGKCGFRCIICGVIGHHFGPGEIRAYRCQYPGCSRRATDGSDDWSERHCQEHHNLLGKRKFTELPPWGQGHDRHGHHDPSE